MWWCWWESGGKKRWENEKKGRDEERKTGHASFNADQGEKCRSILYITMNVDHTTTIGRDTHTGKTTASYQHTQRHIHTLWGHMCACIR